MALRLDNRDPGFEAAFAAFLAAGRQAQEDVEAAVSAILADVRARGDRAVLEYTERFDRVAAAKLDDLAVPRAEVGAAVKRCKEAALAALRLAAERIDDYHRRQLPDDLDYVDAAGVRLGARWRPIAAAGLYVPGGTAA